MKLNALLRFTPITASHCCSVMRSIRPSLVIPALFTRMSTDPKSSFTCLTTSSLCAKSAALLAYPLALTPRAAISASVALPFSSITKSVNAMFAPSCANFNAMALPMPRAAPVTRAVLPVNNPIFILFMLEKYFDFVRQRYKLTLTWQNNVCACCPIAVWA